MKKILTMAAILCATTSFSVISHGAESDSKSDKEQSQSVEKSKIEKKDSQKSAVVKKDSKKDSLEKDKSADKEK